MDDFKQGGAMSDNAWNIVINLGVLAVIFYLLWRIIKRTLNHRVPEKIHCDHADELHHDRIACRSRQANCAIGILILAALILRY